MSGKNLPLEPLSKAKQALKSWQVRLGRALVIGIITGALIAFFSPGQFLTGWLAASVLLVPGMYALIYAWEWGGRDRTLAWMMVLAFFLRLAFGIGLSMALPVWGYDEPEQKAGYLFRDAYQRDRRAWSLAQSEQPLWVSFQDDMKTDQYGGLLALSAAVYRYLSPDAHRPHLVLAIGAMVAALGVPFVRQAVRLRWSNRAAWIAAWIYVVYPDAVFFASSQMREPYIVGLSAVALWSLLALERSKKSTWMTLAVSMLLMALISTRMAVMVSGFLAILFLVDRVVSQKEKRYQWVGWSALIIGAVLILIFSWSWFRSAAGLDIVVTQQAVGRLDAAIDELAGKVGDWISFPVVLVYGLAQPVFPAAVMAFFNADVAPVWKSIALVRSVGWYALAPFLLYGMFFAWREQLKPQRRLLISFALTVFLWLLISSARGGGDLTDNPRYRSLMIVWLVVLAGWAIDWALTHRDLWLWRWIAVEIIFLGFFTQWYISRIYKIWGRLLFWHMVAAILILSILIFVGGWLWDRRQAHQAIKDQ